MSDEHHELVPDGDVLLHLKYDPKDASPTKTASRRGAKTKAQNPGPRTVTYRLSSSHLALASLYFKRMFSGDWKERQGLADGKTLEITAEDWNPEAFLILMNVIHGRSREVPRTVSFDSLLRIATLVDYYDCLEAVEIMFEIWIREFGAEARKSFYTKDTLAWIWIAYVFQQATLFFEQTRIVLFESKDPLGLEEHPIPQALIYKLYETRASSISKLITILDDIIRNFRLKKSPCKNLECRALLLGLLTIEMHELKITRPPPDAESLGFTFSEMVTKIHAIEGGYACPEWNDDETCSLQGLIAPKLEKVVKGVTGLSLKDFTPADSNSRKRARESTVISV